MKNKKTIFITAAVAFVLFALVGILLWLGIGRNILEKGGAMAFGSWQDLFGAQSDGNFDVVNASDTATGDATSSFIAQDGEYGATVAAETAKTGKTAEKPSPSNNNFAAKNDVGENYSASPPAGTGTAASANASQYAEPSTSPDAIATSSCLLPTTAGISSQKIIFNEVAWMGSVSSDGETALAASNDEWIELKNISADDVALAGWEVVDSSGGIKINFSGTDIVPAGGFFLLARGSGGTVSARAEKIYSGSLSNAGDRLAVLDPQCGVSDFLDASAGWPGGDNSTKQTLERNADGAGWHTSALPGGTPGMENSPRVTATTSTASVTSTAAQAASSTANVQTSTSATTSASATSTAIYSTSTVATSTVAASTTTYENATSTTEISASSTSAICPVNHLIIVQIETGGASSTNDFVRIFNPTVDAVPLAGWKLRKKSQTGTDSSLKAFSSVNAIASGAYFTWANSAGGFSEAMGADVSSTETIAANNSVVLLDASGTAIDGVAWGTGANQYGEGNPFSTNPAAGQTLTRKNDGGVAIDTDDNASDFTLD